MKKPIRKHYQDTLTYLKALEKYTEYLERLKPTKEHSTALANYVEKNSSLLKAHLLFQYPGVPWKEGEVDEHIGNFKVAVYKGQCTFDLPYGEEYL